MPTNSATPPATAHSAVATAAASQSIGTRPAREDQHREALQQSSQSRQSHLVAGELQGGGARSQQHAVEGAGAHEVGAEHLEATGEQVGDREHDVDQRIEQRGLAERPAADRPEAIEQREEAQDLDRRRRAVAGGEHQGRRRILRLGAQRGAT
jgi:hypothetical protein